MWLRRLLQPKRGKTLQQSAVDEARAIIRNNRYFSLATSNGGQPWVAPIAYSVDEAYNFYYYSAMNSIHSQHIRANPLVAVAIFDSTAPSDTADGLQIAGHVTEVSAERLPQIMDLYFKQSFPDETARARWLRPPEDFVGNATQRFYRFTPTQIFKPDPTSLKVDVRIPVDLDELRRIPAHPAI